MSIHLACEACGARLKAPDTAAGRRRTCPKCASQIAVPHGSPDHYTSPPSRAMPEALASASHSRRRLRLGLLSFALATLVFAAPLLLWIGRGRQPTGPQPASQFD